MPLRLFVATTNAGKLADFREAAEEFQIAIDPVPGLRTIPVPHEHGDTFEANAITKAIYYSGFAPGEVVIADDSGLEVDALGGNPGVRSARLAQDMHCDPAVGCLDARNVFCLLSLLDALPNPSRAARFVCALAVARDGHILLRAEGTVDGQILDAPRGTDGFGYDPLFLIPSLGLTMAEIPRHQKWELSHRGNAFRSLLTQLDQAPL
jgi:XTP/dITP diphosphohydrolase